MTLAQSDTLPRVHNPQLYAETICAAGTRETPSAAHYPAAALVCEFAMSDLSPSPELADTFGLTQSRLMAWDELKDLPPAGNRCGHDDHLTDIENMLKNGPFSELRRSAHTQIFSSVLLRAAVQFNLDITCDMVEGFEGLVQSCNSERPEPRYPGHPREYWDEPSHTKIPEMEVVGIAKRVAGLFDTVQPDAVVDGVKYYLNGEKQHSLAHLQAVIDCQNFCFGELATQAMGALRLQVGLSDVEVAGLPALEPIDEPLDMTNPSTWLDLAQLPNAVAFPHAVKRLYTLSRFLRDPRTSNAFAPYIAKIQTAILNN